MTILKTDFVPYAPTSSGDQVYIKHKHCPAVAGNGADHKRRLGIRRTDDGRSILAHCHHCGESGYHREAVTTAGALKDRITSLISKPGDVSGGEQKAAKQVNSRTGTTIRLPGDFTRDVREWPSAVRAWVFQYGITLDEVKRYAIGYSTSAAGLVFPILSGGTIVGRIIRKNTGVPKYDAYVQADTSFSILCNGSGTVLCLTEDIVSAIKVGRYTHSVALLGTTVPDHVLTMCANYDKVFIFLDDDNRQVKKNQVKAKLKVELVCPNVEIIHMGKDPKDCTDDELKQVLL